MMSLNINTNNEDDLSIISLGNRGPTVATNVMKISKRGIMGFGMTIGSECYFGVIYERDHVPEGLDEMINELKSAV